jgi:hypothetical protein
MTIVRTVLVAVLLVIGAAGLSSLQDDDWCGSHYPAGFGEGSGAGTAIALWPLGVECRYTAPDGSTATVKSGEPVGFFGALIIGGVVWWWREQFRAAWATTLVFAVAGVGALVAGWLPALIAGFLIGVPLAIVATRSALRGLIAGAALAVAAVLSLLGAGLLAFAIPLLVLVLFGGPRRGTPAPKPA